MSKTDEEKRVSRIEAKRKYRASNKGKRAAHNYYKRVYSTPEGKTKILKAGRMRREKFPEKVELERRVSQLKIKYGITQEDYNNLLLKQNSVCAICKTKEVGGKAYYLHVDHCHKTDKIRGLLCYKCNMMLGYAKDNVKTLEEAVKYLEDLGG